MVSKDFPLIFTSSEFRKLTMDLRT